MSPASQGALEVERYIGSCLISSTGRPLLQKPLNGGCRKQEQQQASQFRIPPKQISRSFDSQCQPMNPAGGTWAGGMPLISMASNPRRGNPRISPGQHQPMNDQVSSHTQGRIPLSRLAVHTQGAPLIVSGRFHSNRSKVNGGSNAGHCLGSSTNQSSSRFNPPTRLNHKPSAPDQKRTQQQQQQTSFNKTTDPSGVAGAGKDSPAQGVTTANIDSLSIASDESSGSNNSENSLPRIIKPRKRRKKDRKPPLVNPIPPNASVNEVKITEESQQSNVPVPSNGTSPSNLQPEPTQQSHQTHQPQFAVKCYENVRYPSDNQYKNHRRPSNNNYNGFGNNATNYNTAVPNQHNMSPPTEVMEMQRHHQQHQQQQQQPQQQQQQPSRGYMHRHVQVKVLDDNRNVILPLPICHAKTPPPATGYVQQQQHKNTVNGNGSHFLHDYNEPVTLTCPHEANIDDCLHQESLCRCRYCDSATVIWDVADANGFPDFGDPRHRPHPHHHHHHHHRFSHVPATVFVRPFICQDHHVEFFGDASCLHLRPTGSTGTAILRRSWSDPTSYFSEDLLPNRDVGVIGDRGQSGESPRSSWRGDASTACSNTSLGPASPGSSSDGGEGSPGPLGPLEVSTEIVTSPNGHRDLEIKFYSSCGVAEEAEDDAKQLDDIWSYHESKLQQDFRILLQAEE